MTMWFFFVWENGASASVYIRFIANVPPAEFDTHGSDMRYGNIRSWLTCWRSPARRRQCFHVSRWNHCWKCWKNLLALQNPAIPNIRNSAIPWNSFAFCVELWHTRYKKVLGVHPQKFSHLAHNKASALHRCFPTLIKWLLSEAGEGWSTETGQLCWSWSFAELHE